MEIQEFKDLVDSKFGEGSVISVDENATPKALVIETMKSVQILEFLASDKSTYFDLLSCLTGIDNGPEADTMEVIYNLYSIPLEHALMVKVILDRKKPSIDTVSHIWRTADWHEREAYDLLGIKFLDHPNMRRILMPADWEGYPLRKDYIEPEEYRGMKTIREEGDPS